LRGREADAGFIEYVRTPRRPRADLGGEAIRWGLAAESGGGAIQAEVAEADGEWKSMRSETSSRRAPAATFFWRRELQREFATGGTGPALSESRGEIRDGQPPSVTAS